MRSAGEIKFRLKQEAMNLCLLLAPPRARCEPPAPLPKLPDPDAVAAAVAGTPLKHQIETLADRILSHRFPILGIEIDTGREIDWNRDYVHGVSNPVQYFRRLPYLDFSRAGDHKIIWELNRHQHLVVLAQAWLLTRDRKYLDEVTAQLQHWWKTNPFQRGMNWASALEVAFRALSWIWVYHLAGRDFDSTFRQQFATELCRHARHLETNLSIYFSPNTHLLGEAVALHAIGALFPALPGSSRWRSEGAKLVAAQMEAQVREDGSHFEQSSYYHVYAVDLFAFHALLEDVSAVYRAKLERMAEYLHALMYPAGRLPVLGDDDGGRLFHAYGERDEFGRATLATCSVLFQRPEWLLSTVAMYEQAVWWIGPAVLDHTPGNESNTKSRLFSDAGTAVMISGDVHAIADAGPFGAGSGGHSHSDTLSIVVRRGSEDLLIDPGTYTYISDPQWRNRFRGSAAHNTVRVNGRDQALPAGPFRWSDKPEVEVKEWTTGSQSDRLDATCTYGGIRHRRVVVFQKPHTLLIFDQIEAAGSIAAEQFWHPARVESRPSPGCFEIGRNAFLAVAPGVEISIGSEGEYGWRSRALGTKEPVPLIVVAKHGEGTVVLAAAVQLSANPIDVAVSGERGRWRIAVLESGTETSVAVIAGS
jgi:hypothetical protein